MAPTATTVMSLMASALLIYSFYQRDYSNLYVMKNSSNDLPALYTLTAFWSSLEGSHTLWTLLLSVSCIAVWTHSKDNEHTAVCFCCLTVNNGRMYYLTVTHSDPFILNLPAPANGRGMNELYKISIWQSIPRCFSQVTSVCSSFCVFNRRSNVW